MRVLTGVRPSRFWRGSHDGGSEHSTTSAWARRVRLSSLPTVHVYGTDDTTSAATDRYPPQGQVPKRLGQRSGICQPQRTGRPMVGRPSEWSEAHLPGQGRLPLAPQPFCGKHALLLPSPDHHAPSAPAHVVELFLRRRELETTYGSLLCISQGHVQVARRNSSSVRVDRVYLYDAWHQLCHL